MSKARIGLVGAGWWATTAHLPALRSHPDAAIAAICDLDAARLRRAADAFDIDKIYTDLETMLEREALDGVMVATHHAAHFPVAKACLERGLHVFIEKPMTLLATHARELVELAALRGRRIALGYSANHSALALRAREIMQSRQLGAVQFISGLFSQHNYPLLRGDDAAVIHPVNSPGDVYSDPLRSGGGHGHLQITHLAGMLFYVTGLRIARVWSQMANHGLKVDLVTAILAEFEGGALASLGGTSNLPGGGRSFRLTVNCEGGWLELDDAGGKLLIHRVGAPPECQEVAVSTDYPGELALAPTRNFVDLVLGRPADSSGGLTGWRAAELLDAAYRSAARGGAPVARAELYPEAAE